MLEAEYHFYLINASIEDFVNWLQERTDTPTVFNSSLRHASVSRTLNNIVVELGSKTWDGPDYMRGISFTLSQKQSWRREVVARCSNSRAEPFLEDLLREISGLWNTQGLEGYSGQSPAPTDA